MIWILDHIRVVGCRVTGVVRVGAGVKIAQLVRSVVMTISQNVVGGEKATSRRSRRFSGFLPGIVTKLRHLPLEVWPI
jgi:hypothetical protein